MDSQLSSQDISTFAQALRAFSRSAELYAPHESAGFSTGFAPTPTLSSIRQEALARNSAFREASYQQDARSAAVSNFLTRNTIGGDAGPMLRTLVSRGMDFAPAWLTGGRQQDLAFGIASAVGMSGMRLSNQRLFGPGAATNRVAVDLNRELQNRFYTANGVSRLDATQGFDRTQLGAIIQTMGSGGAFAGLDVGKLRDLGAGGKTVELNPQAVDEMTRRITATTKALRSIVDIVGSKPVADLMEIGRNLTGGDVSTNGSLVTHRIDRLVAASDASGMDPRRLMELQANTKQMYRGMGLGETAAADASYRNTLTAAGRSSYQRELAARMGSAYIPTMEDSMARGAQQTMAIHRAGGEYEASVFSDYIRNTGFKNDKALMGAANSLDRVMQMAPGRERDAALASAFINSGAAGFMARQGGVENMHRGLSPQARERMNMRMQQDAERNEEEGAYTTSALGEYGGIKGIVTRKNILKQLGGTSDWQAVAGAIGANGKLDPSKLTGEQATSAQALLRQYGGDSLKAMLAGAAQQSLSTGRTVMNADEKDQAARRTLASFSARTYDRAPEGSMIDAALRALNGDTATSDQLGAQFMLASKDKGGAINASTLTVEQAARLLKDPKDAADLRALKTGKNGRLSGEQLKLLAERTDMLTVSTQEGGFMETANKYIESKGAGKNLGYLPGYTGDVAALQRGIEAGDPKAQEALRKYAQTRQDQAGESIYLVERKAAQEKGAVARLRAETMGLGGLQDILGDSSGGRSLRGVKGIKTGLDADTARSQIFGHSTTEALLKDDAQNQLVRSIGSGKLSGFDKLLKNLSPVDSIAVAEKTKASIEARLGDNSLGAEQRKNLLDAKRAAEAHLNGANGAMLGVVRMVGDNLLMQLFKSGSGLPTNGTKS